jgi:putative cell wall-binding protein
VAAKLNGPLLLTPVNSLNAATAAEIKRLGPSKIVIVGGTGAVSTSVENALKKIVPNVVREGGKDRYATSLLISKYGFGSTNVPAAFVATGVDFPDALSAAAYAGSHDMPVLLVNGKAASAPATLTSFLKGAHTTTLSIAGGTGAVTQGIQNSLQSATGHAAKRFGGSDRYATSQLINAQFATAPTAYLATGSTFPDALTGAAAAARIAAPLYVIPKACVPQPVKSKFSSWHTGLVKILGGYGALAKPSVDQLAVCK